MTTRQAGIMAAFAVPLKGYLQAKCNLCFTQGEKN